ncbi:histone deacetylase family protein [Arsukibacterium sp.]|uniref:histone deacetylase family protein n=1 Tax=Arsukibacterium sp. TaxID=1977258 RepID=UPI002FD98F7A
MQPLPALVYDACYSALALPANHRYPIGKYHALHQALLNLGLRPADFYPAAPITAAELCRLHQPDYVSALISGNLSSKAMRRIGFPWSEALITRALQSVGGTLQTTRLALEQGLAIHLSGGYHHALAAEGAGFCLFNDLAVAARLMQQQGVGPILIFDLDVHQGDGTAAIFADDPHIITASIHCEKNFPARKQPSDWDVGLPRGCEDAHYLETVQQSLDALLQWHRPELVLYDAGIDVHVKDELGLLNISTSAIYQRDQLVLSRCRELHIPVAAVIGGGYQRDINALTAIHLQLFKAAFTLTGSDLASKIKT